MARFGGKPSKCGRQGLLCTQLIGSTLSHEDNFLAIRLVHNVPALCIHAVHCHKNTHNAMPPANLY